ncbi:MAG: glycosyl transferase family 2 [Nocardioides sp.]|nr:glycosyl transferase family 2 [Nocardioides sp.]
MTTGTPATGELYRHQPRVRRNGWQAVDVPAVGDPAWTPTLTVTVVVPAYRPGPLLPVVLAALAGQRYPAHLLEVVVADDDPDTRLDVDDLPEVRPERTRVVRVDEVVPGGWGRAAACHAGALVADGAVLHWLDADMLPEADEVAAQARWHHVVDHAAVLGHKWFVDAAPALARTPDEIRAAVADGTVGSWFDGAERTPHTWVEEIYERTDRLREAGWFALRTHTGACASVGRDLYLDAGGMDTTLRLGEDIALGARLGEAGAVFVPDDDARSWHLGMSTVMGRRVAVNTYNDPHHADGSPVLRAKRYPGRTYAVPYLEVVLDARDHVQEQVAACVDAVLASSLHDLAVTLVGPWSRLTDARATVLDDALVDVRILHATYRNEPRVRLVEPGAVPDRSDAPFRLTLPDAVAAPQVDALERLLLHLEHTHDGLRLLHLPGGSTARLERTAALSRARRLVAPDEHLDDVLDQVAGVEELSASRAGFLPSYDVAPVNYPRTGGPALSSEDAWARAGKQLGLPDA